MENDEEFDLSTFLPYLLNQAAEAASVSFRSHYKDRYGMLRTEWRVLFHLGQYGGMTAKELCVRSNTHKTKVSRAVAALEKKRFIARQTKPIDRRQEQLELTQAGKTAFAKLRTHAHNFELEMGRNFSSQDIKILKKTLSKIAALSSE